MDQDIDDIPLSQSNVSLKLEQIQQRCQQLLEQPDELGALSLEEPLANADNNNPYSRG